MVKNIQLAIIKNPHVHNGCGMRINKTSFQFCFGGVGDYFLKIFPFPRCMNIPLFGIVAMRCPPIVYI